MKTKRQTVAKKIRSATTDTAKREIAIFGRRLLPIERAADSFRFFLRCFREWEKLGRKNPDKEISVQSVQDFARWACAEFLDVLERKDTAALRSLADFLDEYRGQTVDEIRLAVLSWKEILAKRLGRMTISELADRINFQGEETVLRRIAKELSFPIARARAGRRSGNPDL